MSPSPINFPLRWESTGDQWWYVSPVDWAAANGHYDVVRELIRLDANNLIKLTSLRRIRRLETVWDDQEQFHHVSKCRSEVARNLSAECRDLNGGWLLYTAASAGDLGFVEELLGRDPLLVFGEGEYGVTDILYAAARSNNSQVFRVVLDFAAFPRLGDKSAPPIPSAYKLEIMNRALHAAARGGNLALLKELLPDCSDSALAYRDIHGATILHAAAGRGQAEVVRDLISSAPEMLCSMDNSGNTPLHLAAHRGYFSAVEALIAAASPSLIAARNNAGETFLHSVISGFQNPCFRPMDHQINLLKRLLTRNLFPVEEIINAQNNKGATPLHLAITENVHSDLVQLLMTVGCINLNIRDAQGLTPLDILRRNPCSPSSELLTRHLISAGGIFSSQDFSARKVMASHIRRQSMGGSPGTSFRISDVEIFLYTGVVDNSSETTTTLISPGIISDQSPSIPVKPDSMNSAAQRGKGMILFTWSKTSEKLKKKLVPVKCGTTSPYSDQVHVPLRTRFSNKKGPLSVRSNQSSPMAKKKKLASETKQRSTRSSSFSKLSFSSLGSLDVSVKENQTDQQPMNWTQRHLWETKRLMKCFGGPGRQFRATAAQSPQYDHPELTALSAA